MNRRSFRLRTILIVAFVAQAVLATGLVGYYSYRRSRQAVHETIAELQAEVGARIEEHLLRFLATPHLINQLNANAIRLGTLDMRDPESLERHLWEQIHAFPEVSSIYFANPAGGLVDAGREGAGGPLYVIATDEFTSGPFRKYSTDEEGNRTDLLQTVPDFDARTRSWFTSAVDREGATWSDIYVLFSGQDMAISASRPVYDSSGTLLAVVASDIFLSQIGDFLADLETGGNGVSYIAERSGLLVSNSTQEPSFAVREGRAERYQLCQSPHELICSASQHILEAVDSFSEILSPWQSRFDLDGKSYAVRIAPVRDDLGVDWLIATAVPEADFMAQIRASNQTTIFLIVLSALLALSVGIVVAQWATRPIARLQASARALASRTWDPVPTTGRIHEVSQLADSLNRMATDLQRTMDELRASEARYSLLANHAADVIWTMDLEGRFTYISPSVEALFGYTVEEVMARPIRKSLSKESRAFIEHGLAQLRAAFAAGEKVSLDEQLELEQRRKDGSTIWTESRLSAIVNDDGTFLGILGVTRDISARRRAEQERLAIEAHLRQSQRLESIGTLASGIAHEINNPLTGIINYADLIGGRIEDNRLREYAEGITREGKRVAEIVRSLLSFSRQDTAEYQPEQIEQLVEASLRLLGATLREDQIDVIQDLPKDLPLVWCRGQHIEQILINLLANARDALNLRYPGRHEDKAIRISAQRKKAHGAEWIRITVEDAGVGISTEILERIFDPFFTTKPRDEGTGLGLSVSYGIVKEHRGELSVESTEGVGTKFHIDLPVERQDVD